MQNDKKFNSKKKLLLIVGKPGSGKSKLLENYSKSKGIPVLNLDQILGKKIPDGKDESYVYGFMDGFLAVYSQDEILLDKKAILYEEGTNIDLLPFLKKLSESKRLVATFSGYIENDKLYHLRSNEVDKEYDIDDSFEYIELK